MNDIDEILLNIDKDDDGTLFPVAGPEEKTNDDLSGIIDSGEDSSVPEVDSTDHDRMKISVDAGDADSDESVDSEGTTIPQEGGFFTVRGTKTWNRREPYVITVDPEALAHDIESQKRSFYFVDAPTDQESIRLRIKQEIVAFLRRPDDHITERYAGFIYGMIVSSVSDLIEDFGFDSELKQLFTYHVGPFTIFRIIKDRFVRNKFGYCYKYLPGNKAARYYPEEYIKFIILRWYEENINCLEMPYDSIHDYEEIKKIVARKYQGDLRTFNTRLDQLAARIGSDKRISRNKLLVAKGAQWFGHGNMELYRRFLGTSVFL